MYNFSTWAATDHMSDLSHSTDPALHLNNTAKQLKVVKRISGVAAEILSFLFHMFVILSKYGAIMKHAVGAANIAKEGEEAIGVFSFSYLLTNMYKGWC